MQVAVSNAECTGKNSTSLLRQPEPQTSDIRGDSTNIPFKPGLRAFSTVTSSLTAVYIVLNVTA